MGIRILDRVRGMRNAGLRELGRSLVMATLLVSTFAYAAEESPPRLLNEPMATDVMVRVVAHGAMVLGDEVGGARVTITDVATGRLLASGLQLGEPGDQNQIMR